MLHEIGFASELIERQLAHAERNKSKAAYDHSARLSERRQMMQAWADMLDEMMKPKSNVVPIGRRGLILLALARATARKSCPHRSCQRTPSAVPRGGRDNGGLCCLGGADPITVEQAAYLWAGVEPPLSGA